MNVSFLLNFQELYSDLLTDEEMLFQPAALRVVNCGTMTRTGVSFETTDEDFTDETTRVLPL
jgi:hypothetical protein